MSLPPGPVSGSPPPGPPHLRPPGPSARRPFLAPRTTLALAILAAVAALLLASILVERMAVSRLRAAAAARGYEVSWRRLTLSGPTIDVRGLRAWRKGSADTLVTAERARVAVAWTSFFAGHPRPRRVQLTNARITQPVAAPQDSLAELEAAEAGEEAPPREAPPLAKPLRSALAFATRDFARLPWVEFANVTMAARGGPVDSLAFESLRFDPRAGRRVLEARGRWYAPVAVPFAAAITRISGGRGVEVRFESRADVRGDHAPLALRRVVGSVTPAGPAGRFRVDGRLEGLQIRQQALAAGQVAGPRLLLDGMLEVSRRPGRLALADSSRLQVGRVPLQVGFALDEQGPIARIHVRADGLTADRLRRELPAPLLGPLAGLAIRGSFDYRLDAHVNFARLDSAEFKADVIPHGLWLDEAASDPSLAALSQPFEAVIRLPGGRTERRFVGPENPFFTPLDRLPPGLVYAVLANEDGGFFQHKGFSSEAMRLALALNLERGRFVRGAGTLSMQLVRNLYLARERSLARKAQEIALTWVLENLSGVSKERMLEIYLNVIEWAPGVHGAGEAARFYFDKDPERLTLDEALFLTTVIPSPRLWKYRFDKQSGELREGTRRQMRFIARAMVKKGWLPAERVPEDPAGFRVELRGQAREMLFPRAPADTTSVLEALQRGPI